MKDFNIKNTNTIRSEMPECERNYIKFVVQGQRFCVFYLYCCEHMSDLTLLSHMDYCCLVGVCVLYVQRF